MSFKYTLGSDIEFPLVDTTVSNTSNRANPFISAIPYIDGTKKKPHVFKTGGNCQRDNVAVEIATPITGNTSELRYAVANTLRDTLSILRNRNRNFGLIPIASTTYKVSELDHHEAQQFGCSPDFNAWTGLENPPPQNPGTLRSFGAHIHVGAVKGSKSEFLLNDLNKRKFIVTLDILANSMLRLADDSGAAFNRLRLYGKSGAYRPTPYGVEYRSLPNHIVIDPNIFHQMLNAVGWAFNIVTNQETFAKLYIKAVDADLQTQLNSKDGFDKAWVMRQIISPFTGWGGYMVSDLQNRMKAVTDATVKDGMRYFNNAWGVTSQSSPAEKLRPSSKIAGYTDYIMEVNRNVPHMDVDEEW